MSKIESAYRFCQFPRRNGHGWSRTFQTLQQLGQSRIVSTDTRAAYKSFSDLRFAREPRPSSSFRLAARTCALLAPTHFSAALNVSSDLHTRAPSPNVTAPRLRACMRLSSRTPRSHLASRFAYIRPSVRSGFKFSCVWIYGKNHFYTRSSRVVAYVSRHVRAAYMTSPVHFHLNSTFTPNTHPCNGRCSITRHFNRPPSPRRLGRRDALVARSRMAVVLTPKNKEKLREQLKRHVRGMPLQTTLQQEEILGSARPNPRTTLLAPPRRTPRHTDASNSFRVSHPCRPLRSEHFLAG